MLLYIISHSCYKFIIALQKINIGDGNGGIVSQLKNQNEMKLHDESWLNYQKAKGEEAFQAYMADLTDMQEHVLPYLQSFCSLEERAPERSVEPTTVSKSEMEAGKTIASVGNGFRILHFCNVSLPQVLLRIQFV